MKLRTLVAIAVVTSIATTLLIVPLFAGGVASQIEYITRTETFERPPALPAGHRLETWLSALEWCESRGVGSAINEVDRDGTPSYYWYQFKPETFLGFGIAYGLLDASTTPEKAAELMRTDYDLTRDIVRHMAQDPSVDLRRQFPDCINTKIGMPPVE